MADPKAVQKNPAPKAADISSLLTGGDAPEGWTETGTRNLYKPDMFIATRIGKTEACWRMEGDKKIPTAPPIQGFPVSVEQHEGEQGIFNMIQIQLTKRTGVIDKEGTLVFCEPGETLLLIETKALERVGQLARLANHSVECVLRPIQKEDIGGGQTMWRWSVKENPVPVKRVRMAGEDLAKAFDFPEGEKKSLPENATPAAS